jgi:hypothetical protein
MTDELTPLDPELESFFDAVREDEAAPPEAFDHVRDRLEETLGIPLDGPQDASDQEEPAQEDNSATEESPDHVHETDDALIHKAEEAMVEAAASPASVSQTAASSSTGMGGMGAGGAAVKTGLGAIFTKPIMVGSFMVLTTIGVGTLTLDQNQPEIVDTEDTEEPAASKRKDTPAMTPPPPQVQTTPAPAHEKPVRRQKRKSTIKKKSIPTKKAANSPNLKTPKQKSIESRLHAERQILASAQKALSDGKPVKAQRALHEHRTQFPKGQLTEERDALLIFCLIKEEQQEKAESNLRVFRQQYPNSLMLPAIEKAMAQKK